VHDPRRVSDIEARRGLAQPAQDRLSGEDLLRCACGSDPVGDRAAAAVLHDDERMLAVLADVVDRHDVALV